MLQVLANRTYRRLYMAQVIALIGSGLCTVALGLLAFDLAGANAGVVLGTALAIKMIANVTIAPIAGAVAERLPRRGMLVILDLVRVAIAAALPFVTEIWQVFVLIALLQAASASFTPTFQATIPDVVTDEKDYVRALSLSRLAYDLESVISPMLAAALLTVITFHGIFAGTMIGFLASACLVLSVRLPSPKPSEPRGFYDRTTRGIRIYLATPRLRGLLLLNFAVACAGAMVFINTVVLVQGNFGLGEEATAWALGAFGAGSILAAIALPKLLDHQPVRRVMMSGAAGLCLALMTGVMVGDYAQMLLLWFVLGLGYSAVLTPSGQLLRRSSHPEDRPALFAAQFALSHGCWLLCYPAAGWLGAAVGLPVTFVVLAISAVVGLLAASLMWPAADPEALGHVHADLASNDPHLDDAIKVDGGHYHVHSLIIDARHPRWPVPQT